MPITFFSCGGIDSGMPLYLLAGLFIIIPSLEGIARVVCLLISLITDIAMVGFSYNMMDGNKAKTQFPKEILAKLTLEDRIVDMVASLTLVALFLCVTTLLILNAYKREREKSNILYEKVNELSRRDELTGLYNRRVLFRKFDNIEFYEESKYHVAMLDIDFFKKINDKYGHLFGDDVLRKIAKEMREFCDEGEYAARYGGEEFVLVFKSDSEEGAYKRIEDFRKKIESIKWEEDAELSITLSGGLVACKDYDDITPVLSTADKMLYTAKKSGRNRICCDAA
jgi:diguanylate cyclase (GGDEF)-like protein